MIELENKVTNLEDTVNAMSEKIQVLKENCTNEIKVFTNKPFKCDQYD